MTIPQFGGQEISKGLLSLVVDIISRVKLYRVW